MANLSHLDRILVVEDEALIMLDLQQTLEDAGVREVVTAATTEDAMAAIKAHSFDAAVLDLHLGRSGWTYDIAHALQTMNVPFVFSSGTAEVADGFHQVPLVTKPYSEEQMIAALLQVTVEDASEAAQ
jgi:CheY-like chemotaxis protein